MDYPTNSIIIPNWNGAPLLPTCLDSLRKQTCTDFEIIVVDNASTDDSRALLARDYAEVRVVALDSNRGFAGGVNAGIRAARGEIIVLLNNDTEAEPTWLEELVSPLQAPNPKGQAAPSLFTLEKTPPDLPFGRGGDQSPSPYEGERESPNGARGGRGEVQWGFNPRVMMVASKLRLFGEREKLHSAGDFYRVDGVPGNRGVWEVDRGQYDRPDSLPPVFGACAGAAAYRRELFDTLGLFDKDLRFNCEDVDFNWRVRLAGFDCAYAPRAVVYHKVSASSGGALSSYFVGRNFILVLVKEYPTALWKKHWTRILGAQLRITWEALKSWRGAAARARVRGQLAGLIALPRFMTKRRQVQQLKRVQDEALERVLAK